MKCKIIWLEYHLCIDKAEEQEILESLPIGSRITGTNPYDKESIEFDCVDYFEAENIEEAKRIVKEDYNEVETFNVSNADTWENLFTEEDFE